MAKFSYLLFAVMAVLLSVVLSTQSESVNVDGDEERISLLLEATSAGDIQGIKDAVEAGEDINSSNVNGWTAACFAVGLSNLDVLRTLIDQKIDLNIANAEGYTPLMLAALQGDKDMVELLLESNADPSIVTSAGVSAYDVAVRSRRLVNAGIILEASAIRGMINEDPVLMMQSVRNGAYVNIRTTGGWNPLIFSCANGHLEAVNELIALGADIEHVDNDGWAPLHFAAINGHTEIVKALIAANADINVAAVDGRTAREMAAGEGHTEIVELLDAQANTEL